MTDINKECRKLRIKSKLSYRQFGYIVGYPADLIKDFEMGKRIIPNEVLVAYSKLKNENIERTQNENNK